MQLTGSLKLLGSLAVALLIGTTGVTAADLGGEHHGSLKDDYHQPHPTFSWTGFYVGGHAGLVNGNTEGAVEDAGAFIAALTATDYSLDGAAYGVHGGYNHQMGRVVVGIEGEFSWADVEGNSTCVVILNCERELDWSAAVVGRVGYAAGQTLFYAKGGVAWGDLQSNVGIAGLTLAEGNETHVGWVVGMGIEHAVSHNFVVRIDYSHMDFGSETHDLAIAPLPGLTIPSEVDATFDTIKIGASYKF